MKVLAIETATLAGSIAIVDDAEGLIGEAGINVKIAHAERLMPSIVWLLGSSGISIKEIDVFAVSIGPGSFTGLRIGLSTVKGLAFATDKPIIPVPTLDAFARNIPFCRHLICPMLDARKNEVYAALYRWDNDGCTKIMPEIVISPGDLLKNISEPVVFTGEGSKIYKNLISELLETKAVFAPLSKMSPSASTVAEIAIEKVKQGIITDPVGLVPLYIRKSEAEIHWQG
ncbi:MAG: tRNA (adenosine(37)-N6)-threonylcarbamoyltransferase complex dimerization subunit type 1 TsaB [Nitrospirae bacterium]|nr:tRNA (adenosine(37)-N6)-threonylcarbamoyltransferase complex dimerization subunit type 1 TsaB [Nitrospirota bacterium]